MVRNKCCAATLAAMLAGAAQAATYTFTYQGFFDDGPAVWLPDYTLSGSFTGNDNDANGIISRAEVTQFSIDGWELVSNPYCPNLSVGLDCRLDAFSYSLTGALAFDGTRSYFDEVLGSYRRWVAGNRIEYSSYNPSGSTFRTLYWTGDTVFSISPPPVPEPSIALMTATGALLLAGRRLRRHHRG